MKLKIDRFTNAKRRSNPLMRFIAARLQPYLYSTPFIYGNRREDLRIGRNVSLANAVLNLRSGKITIGDNVIFGYNSLLLTGYHEVDRDDGLRPTIEDAGRDIVVEDNVWITSNVVVIGPVRIGANSVICSGSVVTKDIPPNVLAGGNPAKVLRPLRLDKR